MASPSAESHLIETLDSSDPSNLYPQFLDFFHPFSDFIPLDEHHAKDKPKKKKKTTTTKQKTDQKLLRPLAKRFLPFLSRLLKLLPSLLNKSAKDDEIKARELLRVYRLALDCLACISPCLVGKPYGAQLQRGRFVCCLESHGRYAEAEEEGLSVLEALVLVLGSKEGQRLVPEPPLDGADPEMGFLIVEVVTCLAACAHKRGSGDGMAYKTVLELVDQVEPWFRVLDSDTSKKYQSYLGSTLYKCSLVLVGEFTSFEDDLVRRFCLMTLKEIAKSDSLKDRLPKFARGIISSIGWRWETQASIIFEVFRCAIRSMICKCKVSVVYSVNEFFSLWHYFVVNCREANADIRETASNLLYELQSDVMQVSHPVASIMCLYSAGLGFVDSDILVRHGDPGIGNSKNASTMIFVTDNDERVEQLVASLGSLSSYFHKDSYGKGIFSSHAEKRGDVHHLAVKSDITHSQSCKHLHGEASLLSYLDAMDFFCSLLVEHVDIAWKLVVTENKDVSFSATSNCVQDALYQFCDVFCRIFSCKSTSANEIEWLRYSRGTLIHSAVAVFKISLGTSRNLQSSMTCIDHLVSRKWIQPLELKFLATSFYNIGVSLYNVKQLEQAPVTLKLSCKLLWTNVSVLYQKFSDKSTGTGDDDICESTLIDVITDACGKSANILNILHQCSCPSISEVISSSLLNWSSAESLLEGLPVPMVLVKQWVKIVCKDFGDVSVVDDAPLLFLLLSKSCSTWSKKTMGTILEQELLAYAEMDTRSPNLCQKMQLKIIEILLQEVYVTKEYYFQRSQVLVRQGMVFRACGGDGLQSCLQCLADAISLLKNISGKTSGSNYALCHQLAITYFLHAQCTQEADQNMEVILDDVNSALKLWFDANITGQCSSVAFPESMIENAVPLLFHVADLLSLLGELQLRGKIHRLIIMLCKWKNVPPEKCLAMFWREGQLGHTLCASPIDETFIQNFSEQYSIHANDIVVWINSLKDSRPLLLGFFQKFLLSDSISPHVYISDADRCFGSEATVDEIKKAASSLLSGDATGSRSMFIAGCLYYDLSERLFTNGQLFEALSYAKEALRLRTRVLRRKFNYASDRQCAKINGTLETSFNCSSDQVHLEVIGSVIAKIWPDVTPMWNPELSALSPWSVLKCYLESTLQVGTIHESLGNAADAEAHFRVGKQISYLQNVQLFKVSFGLLLGKLYQKKQLWDLAENEINSSKQIFLLKGSIISCRRCKLILDVDIDFQSGELSRSIFNHSVQIQQIKDLSYSVELYKTALEKLNQAELDSPLSISQETYTKRITSDRVLSESIACCNCVRSRHNTNLCVLMCSLNLKGDGLHTKIDNKKPGKTRNSSKILSEEEFPNAYTSRRTRSSSRTSQSKIVHKTELNQKSMKTCVRELGNVNQSSENKNSMHDSECVACVRGSTDCWRCFLMKMMEIGSVRDLIYLKWDCFRRRLLLRLLTRIGKCTAVSGSAHDVHEIYWQCFSVMFNKSPFSPTKSGIPHPFLLEFVEGEYDLFSVECATILYNLSWSCIKTCLSDQSRITCCSLSEIKISRVASWLLQTFIVCHEIPSLFQKVSRLLSIIFLLSTSGEPFSLPSCAGKSLTQSHWASYFHQTSIGTYTHQKHLLSLREKLKVCSSMTLEAAHHYSSVKIETGAGMSYRFAEEKLEILEGCVGDFFLGFPNVTCICISLLGGDYANLIGESFLIPSFFPAWMLLSRFSSKGQPVIMLLPVDLILEGTRQSDDACSFSGCASDSSEEHVNWECPWACSVVDDVAPQFKAILKENYLSNLTLTSADSKIDGFTWWSRKLQLNDRLDKFLRDMEDLWFGAWRCLLLGERLNCERIDMVITKLMADIKSKCKIEPNECLLRTILGGSRSISESEACVSQFILYNGYFGRGGCCGVERCRNFSITHEVRESMTGLLRDLILEAIAELVDESADRNPLILVLDADVQMLPWENLPVLRKWEVYRMPSLASVITTLGKSLQEEPIDVCGVPFPSIDPSDAYYVLNPSGDLSTTQVEFEEWFREKKWEGKAGNAPTAEELVSALQNHDLFVYFGHGNGTQYITGHEIQKLNRCSATLLMGCSSGSLQLKGSYAPRGAPLSYLFAGSPAVIANLWDVTDKDINRFSKVILNTWLREESDPQTCCTACHSSTNRSNVNTRRKATRGKKLQENAPVTVTKCEKCRKEMRVTSFMSQARDACKLPLLIGAAPVCYGVPTVIKRKDS